MVVIDVCSNITGDQATTPTGYAQNSDGTCTPPVVVIDVCSNITGDQSSVPSGYTQNSDGTCTLPIVVVDVCSNITGDQATLPTGYTQNGDGTCTPPVVVVDVCSNITGDQATLPAGYTQNGDGTCTAPVVVIDLCSNITGDQATIPSGLTESGGICTLPASIGGGGTVTVASTGGGGGGGGGSYTLMIVNPTVRQTCDGLLVEWSTSRPAQSRALVGTTSVGSLSMSAPLLGYGVEFATSTIGTTHAFTIPVINGVTYYLRPVSVIPGYAEIIGPELSFTAVDDPLCRGGVTIATEGTATVNQCPYITDYLKFGQENSLEQVIRLQLFLKYKEGIDVPISGTFDKATEQGVRLFQEKYRSDVLEPWGPETPSSGYVYILTQWKINQLICGGEKPRPTVTPVRTNTVTPIPPNSLIGIRYNDSVNINIEQEVASSATSTPGNPFTIAMVSSTPNLAAAITAVSNTDSTLFGCDCRTIAFLLLFIVFLLILILLQGHYPAYRGFLSRRKVSL